MNKVSLKSRLIGTAFFAALTASTASIAPAAAYAQAPAVKPSTFINVSVGSGRAVRLPGTMSDLFVAEPNVADVQVRSANQIYIFGKSAGETTVYATNKAGKVIYSANVRVGNNIDSIDSIVRLAMPESTIRATPMNGVVLLTGTVAAPEDVEEASRIVQAYVGDGTKIISRLKTATPQQVMLRVKIAEVSRSLVKDVGVNLMNRDTTGGFLFGIGSGSRSPGTITGTPPDTTYTFNSVVGKTTIAAAGHLFGMDLLAAIDLAENNGRVSTLAEPTLTALSGETASFLAGGEFPIPISQSLGAVSVEYKSYGVGLAFTPTVLADGRISMRVRPEVSQLSDQGSIRLNGYQVPALTTRRAETTVELGSGQSFMIGGLLSNSANNSVDKAPWLGDLPILGQLFRSSSFRRSETELVIIVTPYLVKPVSDSEIVLPTDGFRTSNDAERILMDRSHASKSGEARPGAVVAPEQVMLPRTGAPVTQVAPVGQTPTARAPVNKMEAPGAIAVQSAAPGFSL